MFLEVICKVPFYSAAVQCPRGRVYSPCAPQCEHTCRNLGTEAQATCSGEFCSEGCRCPQGFAEQDGRCIPEQQCPCFHGGNAMPVGYVAPSQDNCTIWWEPVTWRLYRGENQCFSPLESLRTKYYAKYYPCHFFFSSNGFCSPSSAHVGLEVGGFVARTDVGHSHVHRMSLPVRMGCAWSKAAAATVIGTVLAERTRRTAVSWKNVENFGICRASFNEPSFFYWMVVEHLFCAWPC